MFIQSLPSAPILCQPLFPQYKSRAVWASPYQTNRLRRQLFLMKSLYSPIWSNSISIVHQAILDRNIFWPNGKKSKLENLIDLAKKKTWIIFTKKYLLGLHEVQTSRHYCIRSSSFMNTASCWNWNKSIVKPSLLSSTCTCWKLLLPVVNHDISVSVWEVKCQGFNEILWSEKTCEIRRRQLCSIT